MTHEFWHSGLGHRDRCGWRVVLHRPRLVGILLAVLICSSCVFRPANDDVVWDIAEPVAFMGVVSSPGADVVIAAASTPSGPFSPWPGSTTRSRIARTTWDGQTYYAWGFSTAVPAEHWVSGFDSAGCPTLETYVRATSGIAALQSFDTSIVDSIHCLEPHRNDLEAVAACRSPESPSMRLHSLVVLTGDQIITTVDQLAELRCVQVIQGALEVNIPSTLAPLVSLPRLQTVTGDVTLTYNTHRATAEDGPLEETRCGRMQTVSGVVTRYDLRALRTVRGNLNLQQLGAVPRPPGVSVEGIDLGLATLDEVQGHINISVQQPGGSPCGLGGLFYAPRDVSVRFSSSNEVGADTDRLLPRLETVGGSFELRWFHNWGGAPFPELTRVNQLVLVSPGLPLAPRLLRLATVVGSARLTGYRTSRAEGFPGGLARIGSLAIDASSFRSLQLVAADSVTVDGLEISNNSELSTLLSETRTSKFTLSPGAALRIVGNTPLPAAEICAFVALQRARGWSGPMDLGGVVRP